MDFKLANIDAQISPEEEHALWVEFWKHPSQDELRVRLVDLYLPMVVRIVSKLVIRIQHRMELEELVGAGVIGLHDAISNFSKRGNVAFSTFAYKRVKGAVIDELRKQDHLTRTQRQNYRDICAAINALTERLARAPTDREIADETGIPEDEIPSFIGMGSNAVSLLEESSVEGMRNLDFLEDDRAVLPSDAADISLGIERMKKVFKLLDERDQQLMYLRHFEDMGVKEIAATLNISEGRVSQLYKEIILKLRALMNSAAN